MNESIKPMAHEEAEITRAVESYLLNELTEQQRTRFEEHYFECETCADAVIAGQTFVRGIRPIPDPVPWWKALPAKLSKPILIPLWAICVSGGGAAALALLLAPRFLFIPTHLPNTPILAMQLARGGGKPHYVVTTPSATVEVRLPYDKKSFPFYLLKIFKDSNAILSQVIHAPSEDANQRLSLQAASKTLGTGTFNVDVQGLASATAKDGPIVGIYYFDIADR
jgi:hypothetical protein